MKPRPGDKVRNFVQSECHPAEENCTAENFDEVLAGLRKTADPKGFGAHSFLKSTVEWGFVHSRTLVQMELGESFWEH